MVEVFVAFSDMGGPGAIPQSPPSGDSLRDAWKLQGQLRTRVQPETCPMGDSKQRVPSDFIARVHAKPLGWGAI